MTNGYVVFNHFMLAQAQPVENAVADQAFMGPPGWAPILQVLMLAAGLLMYAGLVALIVILVRALMRRIRGKPQGRLRRSILVSTGAFVFGGAAYGGMFYWALTLPEREVANRDWANPPGTLTKVGQAAPGFEVTTLDDFGVKMGGWLYVGFPFVTPSTQAKTVVPAKCRKRRVRQVEVCGSNAVLGIPVTSSETSVGNRDD
jgi:hypothetical protein